MCGFGRSRLSRRPGILCGIGRRNPNKNKFLLKATGLAFRLCGPTRRVALHTVLALGGSIALAQTPSIAGSPSAERPCSLLSGTPGQLQASTPADLLQAYNAQAHLFRSIHLIGTMRGSTIGDDPATGRHRELAVILDLLQPDMLRINGVVPYAGSRVFELTSDGKDFGLLAPGAHGKLYFFGPVDAPARSQNAWENLRPGPFLPALRWEAGTLRAQPQQAENDPAAATLLIDVPGRGIAPPHTVRVRFNRSNGVVDLLTVYDAAGSPIFESHYSAWRTTAKPSSTAPDACYPRQILLLDHRRRFQVEIHINDLELNLDTPRSLFRPSPPRGVPVKRLDGPGG